MTVRGAHAGLWRGPCPPLGPALAAALGPASRPRRVLLLTALIAAFSAIDLHLTILYASTIGLAESNPLARAVMSSGRPGDLMLWKGATVGLCIALLLWTRRSRSAEIGAWLGVGILVWLMCHWSAYAHETHRIVSVAGTIDYRIQPEYDHRWVQLNAGTATLGRP